MSISWSKTPEPSQPRSLPHEGKTKLISGTGQNIIKLFILRSNLTRKAGNKWVVDKKYQNLSAMFHSPYWRRRNRRFSTVVYVACRSHIQFKYLKLSHDSITENRTDSCNIHHCCNFTQSTHTHLQDVTGGGGRGEKLCNSHEVTIHILLKCWETEIMQHSCHRILYYHYFKTPTAEP